MIQRNYLVSASTVDKDIKVNRSHGMLMPLRKLGAPSQRRRKIRNKQCSLRPWGFQIPWKNKVILPRALEQADYSSEVKKMAEEMKNDRNSEIFT